MLQKPADAGRSGVSVDGDAKLKRTLLYKNDTRDQVFTFASLPHTPSQHSVILLIQIEICKSSNGSSLNHSRDQPGCHGTASLSNVESLSVFKGNFVLNFAHHLHVVAWHHHLAAILNVIWPVQSCGFV